MQTPRVLPKAKLSISLAGMALTSVFQAANANAVTIDFNDGIPPVCDNVRCTLTAVDDFYYARHGVTFVGAFFSDAPVGDGFAVSIQSNTGLAPASISIFFEAPVTSVSIIEKWFVSNFSTSLIAYRPTFLAQPFPQVIWETVASDTFTAISATGSGSPDPFTLTVTGQGIQRVDITPSNVVTGSFSARDGNMDNLTFTTTPVPLPAAVWMLGSALGGLGLIRRRSF